MLRFTLLFTFVLFLGALSAQFRLDAVSGNCYVRTGEGDLRPVDKTAIRKLPVYHMDGSLRRGQLRVKHIRKGFDRPAVYAQAKSGVKEMIVLRPAQESTVEDYYVVRDTELTDHYTWEYIQESWTEYEGATWNTEWSRCHCRVPVSSLLRVIDVLIREGDLPTDFRFDPESAESRAAFVAAINAYARGYELKPLLEKTPLEVHVPLVILADMRLAYDARNGLIGAVE